MLKFSGMLWLKAGQGTCTQSLSPGVEPPGLLGRQKEIDSFDLLVTRAKANPAGDPGVLLTGFRGVGKTVLLKEFSEMDRRSGWLVVRFEAQPGG